MLSFIFNTWLCFRHCISYGVMNVWMTVVVVFFFPRCCKQWRKLPYWEGKTAHPRWDQYHSIHVWILHWKVKYNFKQKRKKSLLISRKEDDPIEIVSHWHLARRVILLYCACNGWSCYQMPYIQYRPLHFAAHDLGRENKVSTKEAIQNNVLIYKYLSYTQYGWPFMNIEF